jgi:hypothetical protein
MMHESSSYADLPHAAASARRVATLTVVDASVLIGWLDDHDALHHAAIDELIAIDGFVVYSLTLARLRATASLKMPDCVVLACAKAHGLGVTNFDERLRAAALNSS